MRSRQVVKILHSLAACGLIGGLACYMILLVVMPVGDAAAYAELRAAISVISTWIVLPSMVIALVSGLLSMVVHPAFIDRGWVWIKAAMGILMFKGVLTIDSAKASHAETVARRIADGELAGDVLDQALVLEWYTLLAVMAVAVANVVIGIWRPKRLVSPVKPGPSPANDTASMTR